ncbi:hypothetical protein ACFSNO_18130 [Streptomyces cirratus]
MYLNPITSGSGTGEHLRAVEDILLRGFVICFLGIDLVNDGLVFVGQTLATLERE